MDIIAIMTHFCFLQTYSSHGVQATVWLPNFTDNIVAMLLLTQDIFNYKKLG